MFKKIPKRIVIFAAVALIAGAGSYTLGISGYDPGQAITEGRCRAGAFIADADAPKELAADTRSEGKTSTITNETDTTSAVVRPVARTGANLIANPGAETLTGANPAGWTGNRSGDNDAAFTQVAGHNSGRALRADITKYTDGRADWVSAPIKVIPGAYYEFSDFYRSNVSTRATLALKNDQGKTQYVPLASTPSATSWKQYTVRFFVPANVREITISHTLDRLGSLEADDYTLTQATPAGFTQPVVSVTFDDGWQSVHKNALPLMKRYNIVSTQYLVSGFLGRKDYVTPSQVFDFYKSGHQVASHGFDHRELTGLSQKDLDRQLTLPKKGLSKCFGETTDFAAPYGSYDPLLTKAISANYQTARSTDSGFNSSDYINPYELKVQTLRSDTTPAQVQAWLDTAKANKVWLILVYHQIDDSRAEFSRTPGDFEADIQKVVASGIPVKTVHDAYAEIKPQVKP